MLLSLRHILAFSSRFWPMLRHTLISVKMIILKMESWTVLETQQQISVGKYRYCRIFLSYLLEVKVET